MRLDQPASFRFTAKDWCARLREESAHSDHAGCPCGPDRMGADALQLPVRYQLDERAGIDVLEWFGGWSTAMWFGTTFPDVAFSEETHLAPLLSLAKRLRLLG